MELRATHNQDMGAADGVMPVKTALVTWEVLDRIQRITCLLQDYDRGTNPHEALLEAKLATH